MANFKPIMKWSGSKRSQSDELILYFPHEIDTYYEPFCGGCSMLRALLESDIKTNYIICSDLNSDLIQTWKEIEFHPDDVLREYTRMWNEMNSLSSIDEKRKYFERKRAELNMCHDPYIFFFIMRTTTNGMPRYNGKGEFNNGLHLNRDGIEPENLRPIMKDWWKMLHSRDVEFWNCDYYEIFKRAKPGDFLYLDPPYFGTDRNKVYFGSIDFNLFFNRLKELNERGVKYMLSFNGKSGDVDNTYDLVPKECYVEHRYIKSGNSSFKRLMSENKNAMVYESLYTNYVPKPGVLF